MSCPVCAPDAPDDVTVVCPHSADGPIEAAHVLVAGPVASTDTEPQTWQ